VPAPNVTSFYQRDCGSCARKLRPQPRADCKRPYSAPTMVIGNAVGLRQNLLSWHLVQQIISLHYSAARRRRSLSSGGLAAQKCQAAGTRNAVICHRRRLSAGRCRRSQLTAPAAPVAVAPPHPHADFRMPPSASWRTRVGCRRVPPPALLPHVCCRMWIYAGFIRISCRFFHAGFIM
jgi:hypothetical protein